MEKYFKENGDKEYYINLVNALLLPRSNNKLF